MVSQGTLYRPRGGVDREFLTTAGCSLDALHASLNMLGDTLTLTLALPLASSIMLTLLCSTHSVASSSLDARGYMCTYHAASIEQSYTFFRQHAKSCQDLDQEHECFRRIEAAPHSNTQAKHSNNCTNFGPATSLIAGQAHFLSHLKVQQCSKA